VVIRESSRSIRVRKLERHPWPILPSRQEFTDWCAKGRGGLFRKRPDLSVFGNSLHIDCLSFWDGQPFASGSFFMKPYGGILQVR
jgi:hypothetical protein